MKLRLVFTLALLMLLSACKGGKAVIGSTTAEAMPVRDLIKAHEGAEPNFETLAARVFVVYKDEKKEQSVTVSVRMEKDKVIWVKASLLGITLAKVLITPDRVSYYEKVSNTYFDGDFALLSNWLGTELDFQKAQNILLGQTIFDLNTAGYAASVVVNKHRVLPKRQPQNFIHTLLLFPSNFKVSQETLSQPQDNRVLSVNYGAYQQLEGSFYPSDITINATEGDSKTKIEVNYKKIELNVSLSFPFTIPEGYEQIEL